MLRQRAVVRGERTQSVGVNRTTALWSIWMVASLYFRGSRILGHSFGKRGVCEVVIRDTALGPPNIDEYLFNRP